MKRTLRLEVESLWDLLPEIRKRVERHLFDVDPTAQEATVMCASELAENAIKYGRSVDEQKLSALDVMTDGASMTVTLRSGVSDPRRAESTLERIQAIGAAEDPYVLYIGRMREMASDAGAAASQLGLYRIRAEGEFALAGRLVGNVLEITATRSLR